LGSSTAHKQYVYAVDSTGGGKRWNVKRARCCVTATCQSWLPVGQVSVCYLPVDYVLEEEEEEEEEEEMWVSATSGSSFSLFLERDVVVGVAGNRYVLLCYWP
jgi:hypothetical protein